MERINFNLASLFVTALLATGCGGGSNMPSVGSTAGATQCPAGIGGMPASCCDATGTIISPIPPGAGCVTGNPGGAPVASSNGLGAANAGSSLGDLGNAGTLVGGQSPMGTGAAATAALPPPTTVNPLSPGALGTALNSGAGSASGGTGSPSGSGTVASGNVTTAPDPSSSLGPTDPNAGNGGQVAAYSGAGGGGVLPNGAHETGFHFGNGLTGLSGTSGETSLGAQRNLAAMGDADPEDYFTRIGLGESIFKKVEKRYRSKSADWATASLAPTISSVVPK
jgi:hypothetical protein